MAGGGGLIQLPALMAFQPQLPMVNLLALNKSASICGTFTSASNYLRKIRLDWRLALPCAVTAFVFSSLGAWTITRLSGFDLKPFVLVVLILVLIHTLMRKNFGQISRETPLTSKKIAIAVGGIAAPIGFYDGFFGPGTGGFFAFANIRFLGMDFLKATAMTKLLNFTTNLAAVSYFVWHGHVLFEIALPMAACNVLGAFTGSHLAMRKGNRFVRRIFVFVSSMLILKIGYDLVL